MAVVVNDLRTTVAVADTLGNWGGTADEISTEIFVEGGTAVASAFNIDTGQIFYNAGTFDLTGTLVYVYTFNNALQDSFDAADPPNGLYLGDGTNGIGFNMAGSNRRVFNHLDGPTEWQCLVLDTDEITNMDTAGLTVVRGGSVGGLINNIATITEIGADLTTLSKALGGGVNVGVDIIRIGNDGIEIVGGTTADRGNFLEAVVEDRSTASLKAHGIIRELTTDVYGAQGPLNFGNATVDSWFESIGVVLAFENRNIADEKYFLRVVGDTTTSTNFFLSNSTITTAGPTIFCDFSSPNIDSFELSGNSFSGIGKIGVANSGQITFANDTAAQNHIVTGNTFAECGRIFPGTTIFTDNSIIDSADTQGSLELSSTNGTNVESLSFTSSGTGHAIIITETGTYDFTNFEFNGFGANDTTDAAVFNNSGGAVTINIVSGDVPTVLNGAGSTTTIAAQATLTITNIVAGSELRIYSVINQTELDGVETVSGGLTSPRINSAGSGYIVGDLLTLDGGVLSTTGTAAVLEVTSVGASGEVLDVTINDPGNYFDEPTAPISTTGGTGTGATFSGRFFGDFQFTYNAGDAEEITLIVFHLRWNPFRINFDLSGNDQSILVQQIGDRVSQVSTPDTFV